ncbi:alcohol dehydrogenase catalytic domain-containing protein [Microbispora bryophytorum]|uniref:alcohol dehydrogenase catalytic domain-containing protein n=1 Tax=Microbispora bryophytorum TaxID=1460882 RepID=UPI001CC3037C|nr:alcohol dehydrogenase catalytic domain-containing protein [Microbispora camponoti]
MRTVVAREVGEPGDVLTVRRVPVPEPGPGQVLVRVDAAPVHAGDLHVIRGRYGYAPPFPAVPGLECAGTVAAFGPGAGDGEDGLRLGQRVTRRPPAPRSGSSSSTCHTIWGSRAASWAR